MTSSEIMLAIPGGILGGCFGLLFYWLYKLTTDMRELKTRANTPFTAKVEVAVEKTDSDVICIYLKSGIPVEIVGAPKIETVKEA